MYAFWQMIRAWFIRELMTFPQQQNDQQQVPQQEPNPPLQGQQNPSTHPQVPAPELVQTSPNQAENPDALYPWDESIENNRHNVRAICDLEGLPTAKTIKETLLDGTVIFVSPKYIIAACVRVESNFQNYYIGTKNPVIHQNYSINANGKRYLASTDWGIVQINDYYHIGTGKDFASVDYVMRNPEACIRYMCAYYKRFGNLNAWVSFTSGAYKKYLGKV